MDLVNQEMGSVKSQIVFVIEFEGYALEGFFEDNLATVGLIWFGYLCFGLMGLTVFVFFFSLGDI